MRVARLMTQHSPLLSYAALLLLVLAGWWLLAPPTGSTASLPLAEDDPLPPANGLAPVGQIVSGTITPTTILDLFFSSEEVQAPPEAVEAPSTSSGAVATDAALSLAGPVFSWNQAGGTFSMDWGDMDRDGDLDLVAGTSEYVTVYRNDGGQLIQLWTRPNPGLGVRWFDRAASPTGDPNLELVTVGESTDGQPDSPGTMRVFLQPHEANPTEELYAVPAQLLRVEPRDYNGDDGIDLLVSTNALDPPASCPVLLYRRDSVGLPYDSPPECVSAEATAGLAAADADGDGDPDLALALHMSKELRVVINASGALTVVNSVLVDGALPHIPYDLAWGDYDRDGHLDLAAAFPLEQEVRIYRALSAAPAYTWTHTLPTTAPLMPLALDWADLDGDGQLELMVGDLPPTVYAYDPGSDSFTAVGSMPITSGRIQEIRAIDTDADTDLDLSVADQYGPSRLYENRAPILGSPLASLGGAAEDVAWGDYTRDDQMDLAVATGGGVRLYASLGNGFDAPVELNTGPASGVAWAAYNADEALDLAVAGADGVKIYLNSGSGLASSPTWSDPSAAASAVAWADWNSDGLLDLAVAGPEGVRVYGNDEGQLSTTPVFSVGSLEAWDVAWADYDGDYYPDLAVANSEGVLVYHSEIGDLTPLWTLPVGGNARSVAWADYDGDGWPELAAGHYGGANLLYDNQDGVLSTTAATIGGPSATGNTTQLAWGDPDRDGDLDLAVANDGGLDLIYANTGSGLVLDLAAGLGWQSPVISGTTSLAWGDLAGDGDLDLVVTAGDGSGWYANNRSLPSYLGSEYAPLSQNPPILAIWRPGTVDDAYFFSAGEVLGTPADNGIVPIAGRFDDPEGEWWTSVVLQFSLDGSGTWQTTPNVDSGTSAWNALADQAVSENARLRLVAVDGARSGPVQRAQIASASPPFRVRATDCVWPSGPSIIADPTNPVIGENVAFLGLLDEGTGLLSFSWDFDDGITATGQLVHHRFQDARTYDVRLTVEATPVVGEFCPTRPVATHMEITVVAAASPAGGLGQLQDRVYLPLILAGAPSSGQSDLSEREE